MLCPKRIGRVSLDCVVNTLHTFKLSDRGSAPDWLLAALVLADSIVTN